MVLTRFDPTRAQPKRAADPSAGRSSRRTRRTDHPWWLAGPALAIFAGFFLLPNLLNFVYPFTNWSAYLPGISFAGLHNFRNILADGSLGSTLKATLSFAILTTIFSNVGGLLLALLLERDNTLNRVVRGLFFVPVLISTLAVGYVFQALLATEGALNGLISLIVGRHASIPWMGSTTWTPVVVALINSWKWVGMNMLIYLAGLKTIPNTITEAAVIDGAGRSRLFWRIRFPLLAPAVTFNVATALIGGMSAFDVILATTQGGPADSTEVFNIYMFRIFGEGLYAQASAVSLILFVIVVIMAVPVVGYLRRREQRMS